MPNIVQEAARNVVAEFAPLETAVDVAIARAGRFLASLAEGTIEGEVGPLQTHSAMVSTFATVAALAEARAGLVATRRDLLVARVKLGLEETAIGSLPGCPRVRAASTEAAGLVG